MGLGLSFGTSSQNQKTVEDINKLVTTNQQQTSTTNAATKAQSNTSDTGTSAQQGTSGTAGTSSQTQSQTGTTTQQQAGTTTSFSQPVLDSLGSKVQELVGGAGGGGAKSTSDTALGALNGFDPAGYVKGIVDSATARSNQDRASSINTENNAIGGTIDSNSAAALLANRVNNDANASLAGIKSNAEASANQIEQGNVAAASGAENASTQLLATLVDALKGGTSTTTAATTGTTGEVGTTAGTTAQNTVNSQTGQTTNNQATTSSQDVLTQLAALLTGTDKTVGTTTSNTTNKKTGFGASFS